MSKEVFIGIDIATSNLRAVAIDITEHHLLGQVSQSPQL